MMQPPKFLLNKIQRQLCQCGLEYSFHRVVQDKYGQESYEEEPVSVKCIYHETNGYASETITDATIVHTEKSPMLLALLNDVESSKITRGALLQIENVQYKVTDILDVQNYHIVADISLEVVQ